MPSWPPGLPTEFMLNYSEKIADGFVMRFATEGGKAKTRLRYTQPIRNIESAAFYLDTDQKLTLDLFYKTYAATEFTWINPDPPNVSVTCRFTSAPSYQRVANDLYLVTFGFEILP